MAALADKGTLVFRPYYPQSGRGPHLLDWAYCTDTAWDSFPSNIAATKDGVTISDTEGRDAFGINVRWNVEGFGYIFITADNAGEFYRLPASGTRTLNLAFELLASRVARNAKRLAAAVAGQDRAVLGKDEITEIVLFESTLTGEGPVYEALERFPLGGPA